MKNLLLLIHLLLVNLCLAQNFEGRILYKNTYQSKLQNVPSEKFSKLIGSEQEYFIKEGMYLSITNGQLMPVQLYKNATNIIYTKTGTSDTVFCINASVEKNKIIESKIEETNEVVLGYKCKILYMKSSNNTTFKYYFSDKLRINPEQFKNHSYSHWYHYLSETKALPLKTIMENGQFKMISEASEVQERKLMDSKFTLPSDVIIKCN